MCILLLCITCDFLFSLAYIHKIYIYAIFFFFLFFLSKTLFVRTFVEKINIISIQLMIPTRVLKPKLGFYVLWFFCLSAPRVTLQKKIWKILQSIWIFSVLFAISLGFFNIWLFLYQDSDTDYKWLNPTEASKNRASLEGTWVELKKDLQRPEQLSELDYGLKWVLRTLVIHVTHLWWWFSC